MSDLDDLAAAARGAHRVPVRRVGGEQPGVHLHVSPPARPRSAFSSGFLGTMGVFAALVVLGLLGSVIKGCDDQVAKQKAQQRREDQVLQESVAAPVDTREGAKAQAYDEPSAGSQDAQLGSSGYRRDGSSSSGKTEHVNGYTRQDGTHVNGYNRRAR